MTAIRATFLALILALGVVATATTVLQIALEWQHIQSAAVALVYPLCVMDLFLALAVLTKEPQSCTL